MNTIASKSFLFIFLLGVFQVSHAIEEPKYELVDQLGDVEIRRYQPSIQAVTKLNGSSETSGGFRRLANFIFGGNDEEKSIAMTAPVQETLDVAQPVMAFTMPSEYRMSDLPNPQDENVELIEIPERSVAVIRFSGWASNKKTKYYKNQLKKQLAEAPYSIVGEPSLNQYNPPWTLPFLRRNEIMIPIKEQG